MVIEAMCSRYSLDKAVMTLPKKDKPAKEAENVQQQPAEERPTEVVEEKPAEEKPTKKRGKAKK